MRGLARGWAALQQVSKAAILALVLVLLFVVGLQVAGREAPSVGVLAGFVVAAAALVLYSERSAGRDG